MKKDKLDMADWWGGTVILTFFPTFITIVIDLICHHSIDLDKIIGGGELILSAFLVTTPSIIDFYHNHSETKKHNEVFWWLLFTVFFQLVTYTSIKVNTNNDFWLVAAISAICVTASLILGWKGTISLKKEGGNENV